MRVILFLVSLVALSVLGYTTKDILGTVIILMILSLGILSIDNYDDWDHRNN